MAENERLVEFELLGQQFKFYTAASEEEMARILSMIRDVVEEDTTKGTGTLPVGKIAVLACLNMASRLVREQDAQDLYRDETEKRMAKLSDDIRGCLVEGSSRT